MGDVYLVLNETAHGKRFWRATGDPDLEKLSGSNGTTLAVFGPAEVGKDGYSSIARAVAALADIHCIWLCRPKTWPEPNNEEI